MDSIDKESKLKEIKVIAAYDAYDEAEEEKRKVENDITEVNKKLEKDYGTQLEFAKLDGECFSHDAKDYTYTICMFDKATQKSNKDHVSTHLGYFEKWIGAESKEDDKYYTAQLYTRGTRCWNGPERSESSFERSKEEIIRALVAQLISIYDNVLQEYIEAEINRQNGFRQTIKNQTNTKIVDYSKQKIKLTTLTITLRAAKRIDRLLSLSNKNFLIVDIFPNLDIRSKDTKSINKKKEENSLRENILKQVYESAGYESAEYYYIDEELPRYYPGNNNPDNEESPRYYPDNKESILLMNES
ncbi:hypothetical protein GLOIN_2v1870282 [Rhizophagus irregularis DAOM 181602=DAOM 197198]|uniref:Glucosidase 2 subunit beta-like domain-containing protein n=1 Tax=Rhizophagus irregularis (strain DAOM 181602 / DAOM 197198 / MUCL 43194) TaxID=747089 RepID=A0A2P4QM19_RHIID|nr:hypothetical protein GLOIN_2v1870282 [Rhizophagus irregularis DAOM 181602=DAOM 197198]POG78703.1 hypothetical protein GLOIN_2v1870282 [Rhizophagus irregularis DAOM 181602=DAOM 197198]|eukprot:XP_025185569.1 hypothetical protein GLOIN_2v1870282 [Rhizophagus irregularis DAOM 181602=DAOM 197198]